jgi:TRAP-type C4-dicarboxylate transport system permease small subunit
MNALSAVATGLSRFMYVIAGIALAGSMFLTVADVILRQFKVPIVGTYELVGLLGAVVVGFAIPQTSRLQGHVIMDFITSKLSQSWQTPFHVLTRILAIGTFAMIAWNLWGLGNDLKKSGEVSLTCSLFTLWLTALPFAVLLMSGSLCRYGEKKRRKNGATIGFWLLSCFRLFLLGLELASQWPCRASSGLLQS